MKSLKLGPDGFLYLNLGSSCNVCAESNPTRATILRYTKDGKPAGGKGAVWAESLRNSQGFAWQPQTLAMYATNDGADMRSSTLNGKPNDDLPPEHLNRIEAGAHYGWPYCWGNKQPDPNFAGPAGICEKMQAPALTFPAHSTPIGIAFVDKPAFPPDYQGDAIVALHGSWNRATPSGYKVIRVKFKDGQPVGFEDFITGWLNEHEAWGRPVDVMFGPKGSLYISDDRAGIIYRVVYKGDRK
jgi:glucose/arabinose dehydrogenase